MILTAAAVSLYALVGGFQLEVDVLLQGALIYPLAVICYAVVGGLILARYPRHAVGWLLLAISGAFLLSVFGAIPLVMAENGRLDPSDLIVRVTEWTGIWAWIPLFTLPVVFLPLYFPTGRLLSRRWRIVLAAGVVGMFSFMVANAVTPSIEEFGSVHTNPIAVPGGEAIAGILNAVSTPLYLVAIIGALASMVVRYRRAGASERLQMKWLFYPIGMAIIWWLVILPVIALISPQLADRLETDLGFLAFWLLIFAIPVAIGIAILRYRLFDINVVIRRTLIYGVVTVALAAVYFGSVVLLQQLSARLGGEQSPVAIVISTLLIAALFSRVRRRVQNFIDRRFYRSKYDKAQTLAGFAQVARNETDLEALTAELVAVVQTTMQPKTVGVWLRPVERKGAGAQKDPT
jgi:hypothetical protein